MSEPASPESIDDPLQRAIAYHRQGQLTHASAAYREVLSRDPDQADALQLLGVVSYQLGDVEHAIEGIECSLALNPRQPGAYQNLGRIYAETAQTDKAIASFHKLLELNEENATAHCSLGHLLSKSDRHLEALEHYERALALAPDTHEFRVHRGLTLEHLHRLEQAATDTRRVIDDDKPTVSRYLMLGRILRKAGRLQEASAAYRGALGLAPDHAVAQHMLAACGGQAMPERASDAFVRETFDGFQRDFDACLDQLQYRVPALVAERLAQLLPRPGGNLTVLDLGCGTGLCGPLLRPFAAAIDGVDLSPKMLAAARAREVYDDLHEAELTAFLRDCGRQYDVIVAADTFLYLGNLAEAMHGAAAALRDGGLLLFSVEQLVASEAAGQPRVPGDAHSAREAGYRLLDSGRYAHSAVYLRDCVAGAGLKLLALDTERLRLEGGQPVIGFIVTARKLPAGEAELRLTDILPWPSPDQPQ